MCYHRMGSEVEIHKSEYIKVEDDIQFKTSTELSHHLT